MGTISEKEMEANGSDKVAKADVLDPCGPVMNIKTSFYPLGLFAKLFGLFPCYDLNFASQPRVCRIWEFRRILEYSYSVFLFLLITIGSIMCTVNTPSVLEGMKSGNEKTDALVIIAVFYMVMAMGILSFSIFSTKFCRLVRYIDHFASVDKILNFADEPQQKFEYRFSRKLCAQMCGILMATAIIYTCIFILELPVKTKHFTDYLTVIVEVIAGMAMVIPSCLLIFFLNAIRLRLITFNKKMDAFVLPTTPSCYSCATFSDYGFELNQEICPEKANTLAEDLEKMRILHQEISELANETSEIFGSHLIRDFLFSMVGIILYSYFILFLREEDLIYWYIYPFLDLALVCKIFIVSSYCHSITFQGAASKNLLHKACQLRLTPECALQVRLFITKLDSPIQITAYGYFTINHGVVTSILGAITTYFIILVQFKLTDNSSELHKLESCNYTCPEIITMLL